MAWTDALLGGGFALSGVALQQAIAWHSERRRYTRTRQDGVLEEQHQAFVDLVKGARRVQRALRDMEGAQAPAEARDALAREVDELTEAVAVVRFVVTDDDVTAAAESYEELAKELERTGQWNDGKLLRLTPLIKALQRYERGRTAT